MPASRGFTLVEVLVAALVLTVGVLALEGTALGVERMVASGDRMERAAAAAGSRLEGLRSVSCAAMAAGNAADQEHAEAWTAAAAGSRRVLSVTVTYRDAAGAHGLLVETLRWCP